MKKHSTFLRYFISYFIVLCLLLTCFTILIQTQLTKTFSNQLSSAVEKRLDILQEQITENLSSVILIDNLLRKNNNKSLLNYRYDPSYKNRYAFYQYLCSYADSNTFINSIIYLNKTNGDVLSTKYTVKYMDDHLYIYSSSGRCMSFKLDEYENSKNNSLFFLSGSDSMYLFYIPDHWGPEYFLIYTIDCSELQQIFKDNMIDEIHSFVLTNAVTSQTYGINTDTISAATDRIPTQTGVYPCNDMYSLYVRANVYEDYSLVALAYDHYFTIPMHSALRTVYLLMASIGLVGLLVIFFSLKLTYFPLARLAQKIIPQPELSQDYIIQLDNAFSAANTERQMLQEKIEKYHLSIQNSLLESGIYNCTESMYNNFKSVDRIFRTDSENCVYMLRIQFVSQHFPDSKILHFLEEVLPKGSMSLVLETGSDHRVYVVNYIGSELDKDKVIYSLMTDLHEKLHCYCAISNSTSSLLDIPALYENTLLASNYWKDSPVTVYSEELAFHTDKSDSVYPYKLLDKLSDNLKKASFDTSKELLIQLLSQIDQLLTPAFNYPDYIIRCLLIDILMTLFTAMNHHDIKFKLYSELYFETLYYCRSCNWQEKKQEITDNLLKLLELFQHEHRTIRTTQISDYLEQNYASEELTITTLADHFHVSIAYMSHLFKKEFGENFVDYLWKLRFQKATDMLLHTDIPIDTISVLVGYVNPSSFRRKFKQETGLTPSQFRAQ